MKGRMVVGDGSGDYVCVITPTDGYKCNRFDETMDGRVKETSEMGPLYFIFWYPLCVILGEKCKLVDVSLYTHIYTLCWAQFDFAVVPHE